MQLFDLLSQSKYYKELAENAKRGSPPSAVFGAMPFVGALFAACYAKQNKLPVIAVFANDGDAVRAAEDLNALSVEAEPFVYRDFVLIDVESSSHEAEQARLLALGQILRGNTEVVCASAASIMQPTITREILSELSFTIKRGVSTPQSAVIDRLVRGGYVRRGEVESAGQFAVRGGIMDIFPCSSETPVRLDYFGDTPDQIFEIDPLTQRRALPIEAVFITPAREISGYSGLTGGIRDLLEKELPPKLREILTKDIELIGGGAAVSAPDRYLPLIVEKPYTLLDFLPASPVFVCGGSETADRARREYQRLAADLEALAGDGFITKKDYAYFLSKPFSLSDTAAIFEPFARDFGTRLSAIINLLGSTELRWNGDMRQLKEDARELFAGSLSVSVLAGTRRAAKAIADDLSAEGLPAAVTKEPEFAKSSISVCPVSISRGFSVPSIGIAVISSQRREEAAHRQRSYKANGRGIGSLSEISPGDYVVHINHGIGIYTGIKTIDFHGTVKDYLSISYKGRDVLYVPVTQLDMVSLYTAPSDQKEPPIAKLNSGEWQKTRQNVYRSARDMAKELIALYAKREQEFGTDFPPDSEWQHDFEARFQYEETEDQMRSINDIKGDMERQRPMDRLLCGDVGVGKTEVAMRAAFKCVDGGKQCALLVPTTILAWQHYNSFCERFDGFPIKIVMLSRFSSAKQIQAAVKGIKDGTVDIAIGTHRILQKDIQFKRLGLLIVDEEQRFGVAHKEKLKQAFTGVDSLTLSATPIPRTLNMAMSGIRDLSIIEQPPFGRLPVQTYVVEHDDAVISDAIKRELSRAGQVFYLHNRVDNIEATAEKLKKLAPDARIEIAHGKMDEAALSRVWGRLVNNECDILVCTTIIETGVDVPNCNTLIVENADKMGLSQLYQLRGRVGRSSRRAYAYFTFKRDSVLTEVAAKRLAAIRDFTGFGSGYKIAMRDLQIRGAGSILNARQSGHMQSVGYDMYLKILNDAIADEKGESRPERRDCIVDIQVDAHLPEAYISDPSARIEMYKRIAAVNDDISAEDVREELRDRFGELPQSAQDIIEVSLLRSKAEGLGFYEIKSRGDEVYLYSDLLNEWVLREYVRRKLRAIGLCLKGKSYVSVSCKGENQAVIVGDLLSNLTEIDSELKKSRQAPPVSV